MDKQTKPFKSNGNSSSVKKKLIEIKFIKDFEDLNNKGEPILKHKKGEITKASEENAKQFIELGYAEYVEEPKKFDKKEKQLSNDFDEVLNKSDIPNETITDAILGEGSVANIQGKRKVRPDENHLKDILEEYPAISKDEILKWVINKCKFYNGLSQEGFDKYGFEDGKKLEYNQQIKDTILLTDLNYIKPKINYSHIAYGKEYKKIKLADLNSDLIFKDVEVNCQITGEQSQKAIVKKIKVTCKECETTKIFNVETDEAINFEEYQLLKSCRGKKVCDCEESSNQANVEEYTNFSIIFIRDLLDRESLTSVKRYEPKRVYVIEETLPNAKTVNIKGWVFIEPKTKNISIICHEIQHLENQVDDFKVTEEFKQNSTKYFSENKEIYKQINPDIVGKARDVAKQSIILQLHSPCKIYDISRKKLIRGGLNVVNYGDTKCGKSDLSKDVTQKGSIPLGEYTVCETGGRTGFLYTIDRDRNSLIWGSLALNDMGLVVLDGLQSMHSEELAEFREAIEQQEIIVRRSMTGDALARTRILACFNPNKPMVNYIYKCQAIIDSYVFSKSPDVTRFDYFIPFGLKDVSGEEIAFRESKKKPIPEDIFIKHIYWVWSRKPEQIIYTDSAIKRLKEYSQELIKEYSLEQLPIVHNGVRDTMTRLSVAMACQMHSTDETHEKVIVETEHVEKVVLWYKKVLDMLELVNYKQDIEGKSELTDNDCIAISKELGIMEWDILEKIKHEGMSSTQLAEELEITPKTIKRHYELLRKHNLIETKTGKGICLSVKGVKFIRWGMLNPRDIGTNEGAKKIIRDKKCPHEPLRIRPPPTFLEEKQQDLTSKWSKEDLERMEYAKKQEKNEND